MATDKKAPSRNVLRRSTPLNHRPTPAVSASTRSTAAGSASPGISATSQGSPALAASVVTRSMAEMNPSETTLPITATPIASAASPLRTGWLAASWAPSSESRPGSRLAWRLSQLTRPGGTSRNTSVTGRRARSRAGTMVAAPNNTDDDHDADQESEQRPTRILWPQRPTDSDLERRCQESGDATSRASPRTTRAPSSPPAAPTMIWRGVDPIAPMRAMSRRWVTMRIAAEPAMITAATTNTNAPNAATKDPNTRSRVRKSPRVSSHESVPTIPSTPAAACSSTNGSARRWIVEPEVPDRIDAIVRREAPQAASGDPGAARLALRVEAVGEVHCGADHREHDLAPGDTSVITSPTSIPRSLARL